MPRPALADPWWTPWPCVGPGHDLLGDDLTGQHIIELGCGRGDNAAAFANAGAHVVGIDSSRRKIAEAATRWWHVPGVSFDYADAREYLAGNTTRHDVVCSIFGALSFSPVTPLLRTIASRLHRHGTLAISARLPPLDRPADGRPATAEHWQQLLQAQGFGTVTLDVFTHPTDTERPACLIATATQKDPFGSSQ